MMLVYSKGGRARYLHIFYLGVRLTVATVTMVFIMPVHTSQFNWPTALIPIPHLCAGTCCSSCFNFMFFLLPFLLCGQRSCCVGTASFGMASALADGQRPPQLRRKMITRHLWYSCRLILLAIVIEIFASAPTSTAARALWVPPVKQRGFREMKQCPPCDLLFSKLKRKPDGKFFQVVDIQVI